MGGAASIKNAEASPSRPQSIPLSSLADHLCLYQHGDTGEILILVDQSPDSVELVIDPDKWHCATISSLQKKYLLDAKIETTRTQLTTSRESSFETFSSSTNQSQPGHAAAAQMRQEASAPEVSVPTQSNSTEPWKSASVNSNGNKNLRINREIDKLDIKLSRDFLDGACAPVVYLPQKEKAAERVSLSDVEDYKDSSSFNAASAADLSRVSPLQPIKPEDAAAEFSHESIEPVDEKGRRMCKNCGAEFTIFLCSRADIEEHVVDCATASMLKESFSVIDQTLRNMAFEVSETNHDIMKAALSKAVSSFEKKSFLTNSVLRILKTVASVPAHSSDGKWLSNMQAKVEEVISLVLHSKQAEEREGDGGGGRSHLGAKMDSEGPRQQAKAEAEKQRLLHLLEAVRAKLREKRALLQQYKRVSSQINDFELVHALSKGGFGTVYLAKRVDNHHYCAIKVIEKDFVRKKGSASTGQMQRERQIMASAGRYGRMFVKMYSAFQTNLHLFMVMEFCQGGDCLSMLMNMGGSVPERLARFIAAEVALGLKTLHEFGVMHRDVKLDNVLITAHGHVKLSDFGNVAPSLKTKISRRSTRPFKRSFVTQTQTHGQTPQTFGGSSPLAPHSDPTGSLDSRDNEWILHSFTSQSTGTGFGTPLSHPSPQGQHGQQGGQGSDLSSTEAMVSVNKSPRSGASDTPASGASDSASLCVVLEPGLLTTNVGNFTYASPEAVLGSGYDHTVDWWALGILLFHLLSGVTPFEPHPDVVARMAQDEISELTMDNIASHKDKSTINWAVFPRETSQACRRFIDVLLEPDRKLRLGATSGQAVLSHPYFAELGVETIYSRPSPLILTLEGPTDCRFFDYFEDEEAKAVPLFPQAEDHNDSITDDEFRHFNFML